mgnify:CR=1 FL=1|tara:strand:- start:342 stop:1706 length:1365 start_codon:yes stop_codon:yes gene_type:complete
MNDDSALCRAHTAAHANETWRTPAGVLAHPYLVPAGPYEQLWDWDSVFLGAATLPWGSRRYLEGSMSNFFAATNLSDGTVTGCLTRTLPTICSSDPTTQHDALAHAKPILIQGAWLAASAPGGDPVSFERFAPAMEALLSFWDRPPRRDPASGLRVWHDQLESGADNCVLSRCPSARSSCWSASQALTLASPDVMSLLVREHTAAALFADAWADAAADGAATATATATTKAATATATATATRHRATAVRHRAAAEELRRTLNARLWRADLGFHAARNTSNASRGGGWIEAKTYAIATPLWAGAVNASQAAAIATALSAPDMLSSVGLRSTSADDARYSNADAIVPYSNWRGPMWVNVNALACYGLADYGYTRLALDIATRVVGALAADLRSGGTWHEAYSTAANGGGGAPLAAAGFLSWDTLSAELVSNLRDGVNPLKLAPRRSASRSPVERVV